MSKQKNEDRVATETTVFLGHEEPSNNNNNDDNLLWWLVLTAGATSAALGYDVGIMADCILPLQNELSLSGLEKEIVLGSLNFLAAVGAVLAGPLADRQGRKVTVQWCAWLLVAGTLVMTGATNYALLLLGRIIVGLGVGVSFLVAPIYITEVAPPDRRGELNTIFDVAINGGILAGYVTGFFVHLVSPGNWRLMLGLGALLPMAVLMVVAKLPESPRWLMMERRRNDAIEALVQLGCSSRDQAEAVADDMQRELQDDSKSIAWGPNHKLAIGFGFFQQIAGSEAILYYSSDFLKHAGMTSPVLRLFGNCMVGLCKLLPEVWAMRYVDKLGRRTLMMASAILRVISLAFLSWGFYTNAPGLLMLVFLCWIVASFSTGLGPFTFLCASENLSSRERSTGMVYCTVANRVTSGTVAITVVTLTQLMGDGNLFAMYAGLAIVSLVFYWNMTETAGRTLEEIQNKGHPAIPV